MMLTRKIVFFSILVFLALVSAKEESDADKKCDQKDGSCKKITKSTEVCDEDGDEPCFFDDLEEDEKEESSTPVILRAGDLKSRVDIDDEYPLYEKLTRLQNAKVGEVIEKKVDGKKYKLHTRSLKPLLFEIPNAISEDEIMHIKEKAVFSTEGLFESIARGGLTPEDSFKPSNKKGRGLGPAAMFENWDLNGDKIIDMNEVKLFCKGYNFLYFDEDDVLKMFKKLEISEFDDGKITEKEFETLDTMGIENYSNVVMREHPKHRQRTSEQIWLPMAEEYDAVLGRLRDRFGKIFEIPKRILHGSEHMQIVRYTPGGHYHAHHDTETHKATSKPCCHHTNTATIKQHAQCRLCRFMTIMFYLEKPEEGGETAFPAADNVTYSEPEFRRHGYDGYNLNEHCHDANLVVKPQKGTAVAWYNHHVDPSTGWMGDIDEWSLHGGCQVRKGEKWIANLWLTAPYSKDADKMSMYSAEFLRMMQERGEF